MLYDFQSVEIQASSTPICYHVNFCPITIDYNRDPDPDFQII